MTLGLCRPSVAGVVCHPHEHMAVVLHDTMLGATVIKYTSGISLAEYAFYAIQRQLCRQAFAHEL
jgi:hypothetical protein